MNWKQISNPKILSHIPRCWKPQEPTVLPILRACLNVVALRITLCSQSQSLFWSGLVFCDLECELLNENRELFNYRLCICACLCEVVQTKHIKLLQLGLKLNLAAGACTPNLYSRGCCTTLLSVVGMLSPACLVWYRNWPVPPQPCSVRSPVWGNASLFSFGSFGSPSMALACHEASCAVSTFLPCTFALKKAFQPCATVLECDLEEIVSSSESWLL